MAPDATRAASSVTLRTRSPEGVAFGVCLLHLRDGERSDLEWLFEDLECL